MWWWMTQVPSISFEEALCWLWCKMCPPESALNPSGHSHYLRNAVLEACPSNFCGYTQMFPRVSTCFAGAKIRDLLRTADGKEDWWEVPCLGMSEGTLFLEVDPATVVIRTNKNLHFCNQTWAFISICLASFHFSNPCFYVPFQVPLHPPHLQF